jgi:hypothetical protein
MRIVWVWISAMTLLFMVTVGWWVSQPVVIGVSQGLRSQISGTGLNIATMIEYVSYAWGPLFDVFVLVWAFMESQRHDMESEVRGY